MSTTGATEIAHAIVWTATREPRVHRMRQATVARDGVVREPLAVIVELHD